MVFYFRKARPLFGVDLPEVPCLKHFFPLVVSCAELFPQLAPLFLHTHVQHPTAT
jgi:hypothetical protein